MNKSTGQIGCLVNCTAMGQQGKLYQRDLDRWVRSNGLEWTVRRSKSIWIAAQNLRAGHPDKAIAIYQENSIAYHKDTLYPKGNVKSIVRAFVEGQRPSVLKRASASLRFYTSIRLGQPTERQISKAISAISSPSSSVVSPGDLRKQGKREMELYSREFRAAKSYCSSPLRQNEIHAENIHSSTRYYSRNRVPKAMRDVPAVSLVMSLNTEPYVPRSIDHKVPCLEMREDMRKQGWEANQRFVGRITLLQEQGAKARVVAQPSGWIQLAFVPMHNRLAQVAEKCFPDNSVVRDQVSGVEVSLRHLKGGGRLFCTDLSSATDRFPRQYSLGILDALGMSDYAEALDDVSTREWECPFAPNGSIHYGTGQPMGLYGSFPLFHISNMLVAKTAEQKVIARRKDDPVSLFRATCDGTLDHGCVSRFHDGSTFKVVGDDIIFSDGGIQEEYIRRMESIGVTISKEKSFTSGDFAEFAGFILTKTNKSACAFRPYKVPDGDYVNNPIQFLDSLGVKVKKLGKKWNDRYDLYSKTTSSRRLDLSPYLPSWEDDGMAMDMRLDNTFLISVSNGLAAWADESGYTLPEPMLDQNGRVTTRVNKEPLFREQGIFDHFFFDPKRFQELRESEVHPNRRAPSTFSKDPLIREAKQGSGTRVPRLAQHLETVQPVQDAGRRIKTGKQGNVPESTSTVESSSVLKSRLESALAGRIYRPPVISDDRGEEDQLEV